MKVCDLVKMFESCWEKRNSVEITEAIQAILLSDVAGHIERYAVDYHANASRYTWPWLLNVSRY